MFSKIKALITTEVTSIETILSGYFKVVQDLEQHAIDKFVEAEVHAKNALGYQQLSEGALKAEQVAKDVAVQANSIAQQIKNVVSSTANATPAA
jgi:hypothetical protein